MIHRPRSSESTSGVDIRGLTSSDSGAGCCCGQQVDEDSCCYFGEFVLRRRKKFFQISCSMPFEAIQLGIIAIL